MDEPVNESIEEDFEDNLEVAEENIISENLQSELISDENINLEDIGTLALDEIVTNNIEQPIENHDVSESFGKNLLENLSAEEMDNIPLEELGIYSNETEQEDISSEDLLSQIDDVLNGNTQIENNETESYETENITSENDSDEADTTESPDTLEVLFNEGNIDSDELESFDNLEQDIIPNQKQPANFKQNNSKKIIVAIVLLLTILGVSVSMFLKPKDNIANNVEEEIDILNNEKTKTEVKNPVSEDLKPIENNTPTINKPIKQEEIQKTKQQQEFVPKQMPSDAPYLTVSHMVWNVSDSLSGNSKFLNYLKTAGKSIKLSLSADLLLATEYAYSDQIKITFKMNKNGRIESTNIVSSSGSKQIDDIVLQSVKETLNVVKPPSDVINTPNFDLNLTIYL